MDDPVAGGFLGDPGNLRLNSFRGCEDALPDSSFTSLCKSGESLGRLPGGSGSDGASSEPLPAENPDLVLLLPGLPGAASQSNGTIPGAKSASVDADDTLAIDCRVIMRISLS